LTAFPRVVADLPRLEKLDLRWNDVDEADAGVERLEARGCRVLV
jgi:hypothetical protein